MKMRIALLVPTLEIGGVERVFVSLANGLLRCGSDVDLVAGVTGGGMKAGLDARAHVVDLGAHRMLKSIPRLARYMKERNPAAMIAAMTHCSAAAVAARGVARRRMPVIATEHNTMSKVVENTSGLKYRLMPLWSRFALGAADAIVAVSIGVADDLAVQTGLSRERIQVIYNPAITSIVAEGAAQPVSHRWFQPGEPPVILAVARLDKQKDFPTLIRAFEIVRRRKDARLVILGEGPDRTRIESAARRAGVAEYMALPGFEHNPYPYMKHAAVFASSSRWEGFGVALVEALALGTPIVSTDCTHGPAEILCNGQFGSLVPVGDHEVMASALLDALDNPQRRDASAHLKQFTIDSVANSYLSLVQSLISGKRSASSMLAL